MYNRFAFIFILSSLLFTQSIYSDQKIEKKPIDNDLQEWTQDIKKIKDPELLKLLNQLKQDFIRDKEELKKYYKDERRKIISEFKKKNKKNRPKTIKLKNSNKK